MPAGAAVSRPEALACAGKGEAVLGRVILDFGREMTGGLRLRLSGGELKVAFSESLAYLSDDCDRLSTEPVEDRAPFEIAPCPRIVRGIGVRTVAPRSGFRYVLLSGAGARVSDVAMDRWEGLAQERRLGASAYRGWFASSDDGLNRIWFDGTYTAQVDTVAAGRAGIYFEGLPGLRPNEPVIVDGAKRDRYLWYDMAGPKTLLPLLYGDTRTPRNTLAALGERQLDSGFVPACRPPNGFYGAACEVPTWTDATPWWVVAVDEYVHWTGDRAFAAQMLPRVRLALAALRTCRQPSGLLAPCFGAYTYTYGDPHSPGDRSETTYFNAVAAGAFGAGARLARLLGHDGGSMRAERRQLARLINARLWDPKARAFRQSPGEPAAHPQDANVLPAYFGLTSPARARLALAHVRRALWTPYGTRSGVAGTNFGIPVAGIVAHWMSWFELSARLARGQTAAARAMIDSGWGWMHLRAKRIAGPQGSTLEPPSATGWEHVLPGGGIFRGAEGSLAHVWSEGAPIAMTTGFLGITPAAPGFRRWTVAPQATGSGLRWARGRVPTPFGPLGVSWRRVRGRVRLSVSAPRGTEGTVVLGGRRFTHVRGRRRF
jgi:hypothetical protein